MPKNTTGGKKHKRAKNSTGIERKLVEGDNDVQLYGKVNKKLGGGRFSIDVFISEKKDEKTKKIIRNEEVRKDQIALLRGSLRRKCRIEIGGIVLVSLREFENKTVDIIHSYKHDDVMRLRNRNILPKCRIFENDDNEEIKFNETEIIMDEDEDQYKDNSYNQTKQKENYVSNFDLIPDNESDYDSEIENL